MKLLASSLAFSLRDLAKAYCHYLVMRMQFRAKLLTRSAEPTPALSSLAAPTAPSEPKTSESCC